MSRDEIAVLVFLTFVFSFIGGMTLSYNLGQINIDQFHRAENLCAGVGSKVKSFDYNSDFKCENDK